MFEHATEEVALRRVIKAIELFVPETPGLGPGLRSTMIQDVVRYGEAVRNTERLLADIKANGT